MNDSADHPPVVRSVRSRLILGKKWFDCAPLPLAQPEFPSHDSSLTPDRVESQLDNPLNTLIEFGA
jgi:hypothetical protein